VQVIVDVSCSVAFAKVYASKCPSPPAICCTIASCPSTSSSDSLSKRCSPTTAASSAAGLRPHRYEPLAMEGIKHRTTKVRSPRNQRLRRAHEPHAPRRVLPGSGPGQVVLGARRDPAGPGCLHGLLQLSPHPPGLSGRRQNPGSGPPRPHSPSAHSPARVPGSRRCRLPADQTLRPEDRVSEEVSTSTCTGKRLFARRNQRRRLSQCWLIRAVHRTRAPIFFRRADTISTIDTHENARRSLWSTFRSDRVLWVDGSQSRTAQGAYVLRIECRTMIQARASRAPVRKTFSLWRPLATRNTIIRCAACVDAGHGRSQCIHCGVFVDSGA
jgi:hypothetical protein